MHKVIHEVDENLHNLTLIRYPWLKEVPNRWPILVEFLQNYRLQVKIVVVK